MKTKGKIFKVGNGYGIRVSKLWVDSGIVKEGDEVEFDLPIDLRNGQIGIWSRDEHIAGFLHSSISEPN